MDHDEIIQEVRDNREAYAQRFGFDIQALFRDAKKHEGADGRAVISLKPHRIESASNHRKSRVEG